MIPKTWAPGVSDEAWKMLICARDHSRAEELIDWLVYILTDAGSNTELGLAQISEMSGAQIVDALKAFSASNLVSVERGLRGRG